MYLGDIKRRRVDPLSVLGQVAKLYADLLSVALLIEEGSGEKEIAKTLGMKVFLLTDCLINKDRQDIDQYPHGSFPELLDFLQANM